MSLALVKAAADNLGTTRTLPSGELCDGRSLGDIECAHTFRDGLLTIAVAPTDSWADVRVSRQTEPVSFWGGKVHSGYRAEGVRVLKAYADEIKEAERVHLYGASLGGSVVTDLALELAYQRSSKVKHLETYGAPAAMTQRLANRLVNLPGNRYVCGYDLVPRWWPPRRHGYVHHKPPTKLPSQHPWNPLRGFLDHRLRSYERSLDGRTSQY